MKIEEIIHSIVQNNDQIYGYEIIHFPRGGCCETSVFVKSYNNHTRNKFDINDMDMR